MSIDKTLAGFPLVNQLQDPPGDPYPDNNQNWNCVAASVSAGLSWLTRRLYYGSQLKDAVYGVAYQGAQAPAQYVQYLGAQGVSLSPITGGAVGLVAAIHTRLAAGQPVIVTIPSQWGTPVSGQKAGFTTHVVCMCGWGAGWLRAMNPWGGFWQDGDDAYWAARLCYGQVWAMRAEETTAMAWTFEHDGTARDAHGHTAGAGFAATLRAVAQLGASDGLLSETAYDGTKTFLPLENGDVLNWDGASVHYDQAAQVLLDVWQKYEALKAAPPAGNPAEAAKAQALDTVMALYGVK